MTGTEKIRQIIISKLTDEAIFNLVDAIAGEEVIELSSDLEQEINKQWHCNICAARVNGKCIYEDEDDMSEYCTAQIKNYLTSEVAE